ncbi:hypothetical protein ACK3Z3_16120, partial [Aeromonas caviae]
TGISAQSGITTLSGKKCLDLWGQIQWIATTISPDLSVLMILSNIANTNIEIMKNDTVIAQRHLSH